MIDYDRNKGQNILAFYTFYFSEYWLAWYSEHFSCVSVEPTECVFNSSAQQDAVFELISMGFNVALWYTKYASRLAGKEK